MAGNIHDLLKFCLIKIEGIGKTKANSIAYRFDNIRSFKEATWLDFQNIGYINSTRMLNLSDEQIRSIKNLQNNTLLDPEIPPNQVLTRFKAGDFLKRQLENIQAITIDSSNCNPFLVTLLKLNTFNDLITFYVFQAASRSILTSFGTLIQDLVLYSHEDIEDGKGHPSFGGEKWDVMKDIDGIKHWFEIKSGPNDLDLTQINRYARAISIMEGRGDRAFIGETYGQRTDNTMTHGLYRQYLSNHEEVTKIGSELWDFLSGEIGYMTNVITNLREVANSTISSTTILKAIQLRIKELKKQYKKQFCSVDNFIDSLINR